MAKNTGLGRGFEDLIPTNFVIDDVVSPGEHIKNLSISKIITNPDQPRREFDEDSLKELAESIKQFGVIQPMIVMPHKKGYRIVAGERRFRAAQMAGLKSVPAIVREHKELEELEVSLVENVQRVDLSPLEQAMSLLKLRDQFSLSLKQISKKLGKAETTISNSIRLLHLPEKAIEALRNRTISEGHARAILALKNQPKLQTELLNTIIIQKLSVRDAEAFVSQNKNKKVASAVSYSPKIQEALKAHSNALKTRIKIKESRGEKGILSVKYSSLKDLKSLLNNLDN